MQFGQFCPYTHLCKKWLINLASFTLSGTASFIRVFFQKTLINVAMKRSDAISNYAPTLRMWIKATVALQMLRTDITIHLLITPAADTMLPQSALPWQPPLESPLLVPHCSSLVMAAGKLRATLSIVFWGWLLSTRTRRHIVVRQADFHGRKKG